MSNTKKQNPTKFYKYMSADGAISALRNETWRWSSPLCFNDPFDVPRELGGEMEYADMHTAGLRKLEEYVLNSESYIEDLDPFFQEMITKERNNSDSDKIQFINSLRGGRIIPKFSEDVFEESRQAWREHLPKMRVLRLSAEKDIVPMWHHYADKYRGIVLEFDTNIDMGISQSWPEVIGIEYTDDLPDLHTEQGWGRWFLLFKENATEEMEHSFTYVKKSSWEYEKEYRVVRLGEPDDTENYSDYQLPIKSISSIYFGPKIGRQDRECLINLISKKKLRAKVYDMKFEFGWKMVPVPAKDVKCRWLDLFKLNRHRKNCGS